MKKNVFIETASVTALRDAAALALEAGAGSPAMLLSCGEAGTGKTFAARVLYAESGGAYLRVLEGVSQHAFLQEIAYELSGMRPYGVARAKQHVIAALRDEPRPIFVDEADRLHISRLEDLRDIHDLTGSPVILIGETGLPAKVSARSRINDRIPDAFRVTFGPVTQRDLMLYALEAADLKLSPEAAALAHAETRGNFRRVHNAVLLLEAAAKANGSAEVNADLCRAALGAKARRRAA